MRALCSDAANVAIHGVIWGLIMCMSKHVPCGVLGYVTPQGPRHRFPPHPQHPHTGLRRLLRHIKLVGMGGMVGVGQPNHTHPGRLHQPPTPDPPHRGLSPSNSVPTKAKKTKPATTTAAAVTAAPVIFCVYASFLLHMYASFLLSENPCLVAAPTTTTRNPTATLPLPTDTYTHPPLTY